MPMAPIANCAARDSRTRSRSSAAAERRSVARTPSLMRSRRGCGAGGRWAGARGIRQRVSCGARVPSSAREPRGSEGARSRGSGGGNGGGSGRVPRRRRRRTRRRIRRCRRRRSGRRCPRRLPRPAGAGSGRGCDFGQTDSGTGGIRRARAVRRAREGGGGQGEVRARTLATFPNIADISVAAPRRARACYGSPPRATRNGSLSTTRGSIGAHPQFADLPSGGFRRPPRIRHVLTRPRAAVLHRDEVIVARATCTPATSTARARIRRR